LGGGEGACHQTGWCPHGHLRVVGPLANTCTHAHMHTYTHTHTHIHTYTHTHIHMDVRVRVRVRCPCVTQIYFCSRTHSQLTQFVHELRRTAFGSSVRLVTLAGRASLCINDSVRALGSDSAMSDKCRDLDSHRCGRVVFPLPPPHFTPFHTIPPPISSLLHRISPQLASVGGIFVLVHGDGGCSGGGVGGRLGPCRAAVLQGAHTNSECS
jgi:hypothetical protein